MQPAPAQNGGGAGRAVAAVAAVSAVASASASAAASAAATGVDYLRFPAGSEADGEDRPPSASTDSIFKQLMPRSKCTAASLAFVVVALLVALVAVLVVPAVWPSSDPEVPAPVRGVAVVNIAAAIGAAIATGLAPVGGALSRM